MAITMPPPVCPRCRQEAWGGMYETADGVKHCGCFYESPADTTARAAANAGATLEHLEELTEAAYAHPGAASPMRTRGHYKGHTGEEIRAYNYIRTKMVLRAKGTLNHAPKCDRCGSHLLVRVNHQTGAFFWGCAQWPACRRTHPIVPGVGGLHEAASSADFAMRTLDGLATYSRRLDDYRTAEFAGPGLLPHEIVDIVRQANAGETPALLGPGLEGPETTWFVDEVGGRVPFGDTTVFAHRTMQPLRERSWSAERLRLDLAEVDLNPELLALTRVIDPHTLAAMEQFGLTDPAHVTRAQRDHVKHLAFAAGGGVKLETQRFPLGVSEEKAEKEPMAADKTPPPARRPRTPALDQAKLVGGAVANGVVMALTDQLGDRLIAMARKLAGDQVGMLDVFISNPHGREMVKALMAVSLHTAAESSGGLLPGSKGIAAASRHQIAFSVGKLGAAALTGLSDELSAFMAIGKQLEALESDAQSARYELEEDAPAERATFDDGTEAVASSLGAPPPGAVASRRPRPSQS